MEQFPPNTNLNLVLANRSNGRETQPGALGDGLLTLAGWALSGRGAVHPLRLSLSEASPESRGAARRRACARAGALRRLLGYRQARHAVACCAPPNIPSPLSRSMGRPE